MKRAATLMFAVAGAIAVPAVAQQSTEVQPTVAATTTAAAPSAAPETQPTNGVALVPTTQPLVTLPTTNPATTNPSSNFSRYGYNRDSRSGGYGYGGSSSTRRQLPTELAILDKKSMFFHGRYTPEERPAFEPRPPTTNQGEQPAYSEYNLVFDGATRVDDQVVAFIEDCSSNRVLMLKAGDSVARGKLGKVTLDFVEYAANGKTSTIPIGRTLANSDPPARSSGVVTSSSSPTNADPNAPSGTLTGGSSDLLERLRQKRLRELGGGGTINGGVIGGGNGTAVPIVPPPPPINGGATPQPSPSQLPSQGPSPSPSPSQPQPTDRRTEADPQPVPSPQPQQQQEAPRPPEPTAVVSELPPPPPPPEE